jgi:hypothetical protein
VEEWTDCKREEGRGKRDEGRGKRDEGRGEREEGRGQSGALREQLYSVLLLLLLYACGFLARAAVEWEE